PRAKAAAGLRKIPFESAGPLPFIPAQAGIQSGGLGLWGPAFAGASGGCTDRDARGRTHQLRLKPALRLFEISPAGGSLPEPVTLNGPPNSFCSALSVRSHLSSMLEMSAPNDTLVSVGRMLKRSA